MDPKDGMWKEIAANIIEEKKMDKKELFGGKNWDTWAKSL
jgi:hypothetical protein